MGYPDAAAELEMLDTHGQSSPLDRLTPVAHAADVRDLIEVVRRQHVAAAVKQYAVDLVAATRKHPELRLGASPRATLHLVRAARAYAALDDRDYVVPDDVQDLAVPCSRTGCCRPRRRRWSGAVRAGRRRPGEAAAGALPGK